jgi:hypothetical protein
VALKNEKKNLQKTVSQVEPEQDSQKSLLEPQKQFS